ncbi:MAG: cell division protein ZapA [Defluviitaleaceae bacterium]|nr:cell division protein ZapA [Defluviitaleaceae bacterium]
MEKQKVNVIINGEVITLNSAENPEYLQRLARYVDDKMKDVLNKSITATLDEKMRTLIIAFNIADDYIKTADAYRQLDDLHTRYVLESRHTKEENERLKKEIEALKNPPVEEDEEDSYEHDNVLSMLTPKQRRGRRNNAG